MRPCAFLLLPFLLLGCEPATMVKAKSQAPKFELKAETEIKIGIRQYAVTKYTYYEINGSDRRELWSITQNENYLRHWISPSGRVWVATSSMPGPGGGGYMWTRDARAQRMIGLSYSTALQPDVKESTRHAAGSLDDVDLGRVEARVLGTTSFAEQLLLPLKEGGEGRITLVTTREGEQIGVARYVAKGEPDLLTQGLQTSFDAPRFSRPAPRSPLALWEMRDEKTGGTLRILQTFQEATFGEPSEGRFKKIETERKGGLHGESVVRTPAGRILWFGLSQPGEPYAARLTVMRYDGKVLSDVDLLKLGGYSSPEEVREKMSIKDVRIRRGGSYLPIDDQENYSADSPEELQVKDEGGRTIIDITDPKVEVKRLTGLAAKPPKEGLWANAKINRERIFSSPNGKFKLRERRVANGKNADIYFETFLGQAEDEMGRQTFVELWSTVSYSPVAQSRVTDSGRTFILRAEPIEKGKPQRAVMMVYAPGGNQTAGIDLFQPPASFPSAKAALNGIRLGEMSVRSEGVVLTREVEGVSYQSADAETFKLPIGAGRSWEFRIGPNAYGPQGDTMMWVTPTKNRKFQ
ncbi:hypothetical protein EON81_02080 [bacterium]|nr:MAG: hypothetical protein EON81_02080 [bacterium]